MSCSASQSTLETDPLFSNRPEHFFRTCLREDWEETNIKYKTALEREAHDAERKARRKAARAAQVGDEKVEGGEDEKETGAEEEEEEDDEDDYESPYPAVSFSGGKSLPPHSRYFPFDIIQS